MPFTTLFSSSLILGSLLAIRRTHWIFIWLGLELNLISFIPLLIYSNKFNEAEAAIKYFLAQALGSGLILLGSLTFYINPHMLFGPNTINLFLLLGLLTKLGLPPCHFWFPSVISIISWPICIILATWQKLVPIILLSYRILPNLNIIIFTIVTLRSILGGVGGLNQTQLRPLLAYSSIGHISWMLAASTRSYSSRLIYLFVYILITLPLIGLLWISSSLSNISSIRLTTTTPTHSIRLFTLILSLGGLPPFLGFFPKWIVIETLNSSFTLFIFILLFGSILNLYYYLNITFINLLTPLHFSLFRNKKNEWNPQILLPIRATITLGLGPILFLVLYALTILYKS